MRKLVLAAALSGTMVTLAACSGGADEAAEAEAPTAVETTETTEAAAEAAVLDAGTATVEQLAAVEGVNEELAAAIVAGQPYASVTDLNAKLLETLSAEEAAAVLESVFVPVNLNTASK